MNCICDEMETLVVFATKVAIHRNNGYGVAFDLYRYLSEFLDVRVIVPCALPYIDESPLHICEHLTVYYIGASEDFCLRQHIMSSKIEIQFAMQARNDVGFIDRVRRLVGTAKVIVCDSFVWGPFAAEVFADRRIVVRSLDIERDKLEQIYSRNHRESQDQLDDQNKYFHMVTSQERMAYQNADHIFVLTEHDGKRLRDLYELSEDRIDIVPLCINGLDNYRGYIPNKCVRDGVTMDIVFVGYLENDDWHVMDQIASIAERFPEIHFHVVGKVNRNLNNSNVTVYGEVDQNKKEEILNRCNGALNLTDQTYGMNAKLLDYLRFGCQILANENGVRGYEMKPGVHYYPVDIGNIEEGISQYIKSSEADRIEISRNAYQLLFERHNYNCYRAMIFNGLGLREKTCNLTELEMYIFGSGVEGKSAIGYFHDRGISCRGFLDNDESKQGRMVCGLEVYPLSKVISCKDDNARIVIATRNPEYLKEMYLQLVEGGFKESNIDLMIDGEFNLTYIDRTRLV